MENCADERRRGRPFERPMACHHLVDDCAEREDIASIIHVTTGELFRRHVRIGADHSACHRQWRPFGRLGRQRRNCRFGLDSRQTKVEQLRAVAGQHDVARLQVAMHEPPRVRVRQRVSQLRGVAEHVPNRQWPVEQTLGERLPLEILHHEKRGRVRAAGVTNRGRFPNIVQIADMGVVQRCDGARLTFESFSTDRIGGKFLRQDLDRDDAIQPGVARPVHLHPCRRPQPARALHRRRVEYLAASARR